MTVVIQMEPLWGTAECVTALYGLPRNRLLELARAGAIRARKPVPESRSSVVVFCTADVRQWLENEAPAPLPSSLPLPRGPAVPSAGDGGEGR